MGSLNNLSPMKMLTQITVLCAMVFLSGHAGAQDFKARLAEARSIDQVRKFYDKFSEFGTAHEQEFQADGVRFFTFWISKPDRTQMFFWAYQRLGEKWILLVDEAGDQCVWSFSRGIFVSLGADGHV